MSNKQICSICSSSNISPVLEKSAFYLCSNCGIVFNSQYSAIEYGDKYFLDDYKAQYNKTYEEDRENITSCAYKRISKILKLWRAFYKKRPLSLLDIGAALGFFLKAANEKDFKTLEGVEISKYAADYCKSKFNLHVQNCEFNKAKFNTKYDVITAWYFIEHCEYPLEALKQIYSLLNENGLIAFSVPSFYGPQFKYHRKQWEETHPGDHSVDFSPRTVKKLLKSLGFKKVKVFAAASHPERMVSEKSIFFPIFKIFYSIFAKITAFSDTIEVYAIK